MSARATSTGFPGRSGGSRRGLRAYRAGPRRGPPPYTTPGARKRPFASPAYLPSKMARAGARALPGSVFGRIAGSSSSSSKHASFNDQLPEVGSAELLKRTKTAAGTVRPPRAEVTLVHDGDAATGGGPLLYMYSPLEERARHIREAIRDIGVSMLRDKVVRAPERDAAATGTAGATPASATTPTAAPKGDGETNKDGADANAEEGALTFDPVGRARQYRVLVCGRICCESEVGRLNSQSLLLEGANGLRVKLDVEQGNARTNGFSLFPGQVVAVEGMCTNGRVLVADHIYDSVPPPAPVTPAGKLLEYNYGAKFTEGHPLSVFVASGPYTPSTDLLFEPLETLMTEIRAGPPDVLVLLGPFVDAKHPQIASGEPHMEIEADDSGAAPERVDLTYDDVFAFFCNRVAVGIDGLPVRVLMVPSADDAHHPHVVYPQGPLQLPESAFASPEERAKVTMLPNPSLVRINEVVFGLSTADVVAGLAQEEVYAEGALMKKMPRMLRLAEHAVKQRSFYPMHPCAEGALVDPVLRQRYSMPVKPDVLVLPSRLAAFAGEAANVTDTLCVNPGPSRARQENVRSHYGASARKRPARGRRGRVGVTEQYFAAYAHRSCRDFVYVVLVLVRRACVCVGCFGQPLCGG